MFDDFNAFNLSAFSIAGGLLLELGMVFKKNTVSESIFVSKNCKSFVFKFKL
jgi:hypothetical protein